MNYQEARRLRNLPGLAEVMRQRALMGDSAGEAIRGALRDKYSPSVALKAKAMGIKEKFDPMNIVKFMTGGSKTAAALYGRFTGRSQEDIAYFAGRAKPVDPYTRIGRISDSNDTLPILEKMYGFLHKIYEEDLRRKDRERDYAEERAAEDEKRHREFLEALGIKDRPTNTVIKKETGKGLLGTVSDMIRNAVNGLRRMIQSVVKTITDLTKVLQLGKLLGILKWFGGPVGATLLGIAGLAAFSKWITGLIKDYMPDYSAITAIEAKALLEKGSERDIEEYVRKKQFGSREKLEEFVSDKMAEAKYAVENIGDLTPQEYKRFSELAAPMRREGPIQQSDTVTPRNIYGGGGPNAVKEWDRKFGDRYNPDGTRKGMAPNQMPLPAGIVPSEGRGSMQYDDEVARRTPNQAAFGIFPESGRRSEPVISPAPDVSGASVLNRNLNMEQNMAQQTPNIDKSVEMRPRNTTTDALRIMPPVRNMDDTFQRMIYNSIRVV